MITPKILSLLALGMLLSLLTVPAFAASIVVYGGTGNIGSRIVAEALERGHTVTVVSRSAPDSQDGRRISMSGDILDTERVREIVAGHDVVIAVINSPDTDFFLQAAQSVVTALRAIGEDAPRLIWSGGASSLELASGERMIDTTPNATGGRLGHVQVLDFLRTAEDVTWTFVSPPFTIRPGERTGRYRTGGDKMIYDDAGVSQISTEDFAVALVDEIEEPKHLGERFTVAY